MSTPLKALIQERLRAKIVRRSDEEYDYDSTTCPPASARAIQNTVRGYALGECKERSLPLPASAVATSASNTATASASSNAGFPLHLHTEIEPAVYIPHGHPLSARGYIPRHADALSPSPSYARHGHRSYPFSHQSHYHRRHQQHEDGVDMYHLNRPHDAPVGLEMLASPRWNELPRERMHVASASPRPRARGHLHRQSSDELHSRRWHDKSPVDVRHHSARRRYDNDGSDGGNNSREACSPMREYRHERKRERRHGYEYDPEQYVPSGHDIQDMASNGDNQMWHGAPLSAPKLAFKRHLNDREPAHSVRPAERASYAPSLGPSVEYIASKSRFEHHRHYHPRTQQEEEEEETPETSMRSLMFLPPPDAGQRSAESLPTHGYLGSAPAPLNLSTVSSSRPKTRTIDQILSPGSRLAANAFVEKRQRRSGKSTPRTRATQCWLRSLDCRPEP